MPDQTSPSSDKTLDSRFIDVVIRLGFLGLLAYWAGLIIGPFIVIVIWAGILAAALSPVYEWLKAKLGRGSWASLIITLTLLAIILGPTALLSTSMFESAQNFMAALKDGTLHVPPPKEGVKDWPVIGGKAYQLWSEASANLTEFAKQHTSGLLNVGGRFLSAAAAIGGGVLSFAVSVIIAGFIYSRTARTSEVMGRFAERIIAGRGREFVAMSGSTVRNVARGVLGVSLIQAILAGVGMLIAGVPAAGVGTFLILLLGIIQVPPWLVTVPAIIWMWSNAEFLPALLFTIYMVPVTFLDNVLKPILMAKGLKTPMLVIFIGVIGGTLAHGLIGLFLGPIVLAVFYDLLVAWVTGDMPAEAAAEEPAERET